MRDAARLRVAQAVEQLQAAQTVAERASATLRRDAALADVTALSASVDLEAARLEVRAAAAAARSAATFAERSAARARLQAAEARLAPIIQAAARGLEAARSALASDSADAASAAEREAAEAVRRRAAEILQQVREFQASAGAQIATARRLVAEATGSGSGGGSGSDGGESAELDRQEAPLSRREAPSSWYRKPLVRTELTALVRALSGETLNPGDGANVARIVRTPRTIPTSATDDTPIVNPDAFTSATFKDVMHATGKEVFSDGGDEFKVNGYVKITASAYFLDASIHTGLKLTNDGLVIRTGGTDANRGYFTGDFTDMRKDITTWVSDSNNNGVVNAADGIASQNGWDLAITFDEPQTIPIPAVFTGISDSVSNWRGNNAFYWRSLVRPDESQTSGGANYQSDAFNQPAGQENLGTYEVWLSNSIGVNRGFEPAVPGTTVACPDGTRGTSCPDDDVHLYLSYAAYGLFEYSADTRTFVDANALNGQSGRINTIHFGYSAFANEDGQRTADIDEAITNGTFTGYTLAYEVRGASRGSSESKLLRGDVTLTVNIPKGSGAGSLQGTMNNFQRWNEESEVWTAYADNFAVALNSAAIGDSGSFSGTTQATPSAGLNTNGAGVYKGSFYGPRADADELEIAGSWTVGSGTAHGGNKDIYGSFGAKQRPATPPASN